MDIDPATICARTGAGEAELAQAKNGLTLPQRKALSLLAAPRVYAEFAAENNLDPERLVRDFSRLAELGLITLQLGAVAIAPPARPRADAAPVRAAPAPRPRAKPAPADAGLRPVVLGAEPVRSPLRVALLAGIVVVAMGAGWFMLRDDPRATTGQDAVASQATHATTPALNPPIVATSTAAPDVAATAPPRPAAAATAPAATVVQSPRVAAPERAAPTREAPPSGPAIARASDVKLAAAAQAPARTTTLPPPVERAPANMAPPERVADPPAASPPVAPPPPAAPAPAPPPVQVAAAAKTAVAPLPTVNAALQPIVRETPEFPKEAINEGVMTGTVRARVTLDGSGKVTGIEILDAQPRRVFDRAVRAALWRWQYEPGAPNRTADVEVAFVRQ